MTIILGQIFFSHGNYNGIEGVVFFVRHLHIKVENLCKKLHISDHKWLCKQIQNECRIMMSILFVKCDLEVTPQYVCSRCKKSNTLVEKKYIKELYSWSRFCCLTYRQFIICINLAIQIQLHAKYLNHCHDKSQNH